MKRPILAATALVLAFASLTSACARDASCGISVAEWDSSGVTIVENRGVAPLNGGGWSVAERPELSIGAAEGDPEEMLYDVTGAHRLADGRIAVANAGTSELRLYDRTGGYLGSFGQRGEGPGEFTSMRLVGVTSRDVMVLADAGLRRITTVHPDEGMLGNALVDAEVLPFLNPAGLFADGSAVFGGHFDVSRVMGMEEGLVRAPTLYRSCAPDGSLAADFGDFPGVALFLEWEEREGRRSLSPYLIPFGMTPQATVSADLFYFGGGDRYEIQAHAPSGELVRLIRLDREPIRTTQEDKLHYIEETVPDRVGQERARELRALFEHLPASETFPAYGRLKADVLGYLWVEEYRLPGEVTPTWNIFDPNGALAGRVSLPPDVSILEIGVDYLLGINLDEMDVEYVEVYRLERPGA
jgi:hypothetical protein